MMPASICADIKSPAACAAPQWRRATALPSVRIRVSLSFFLFRPSSVFMSLFLSLGNGWKSHWKDVFNIKRAVRGAICWSPLAAGMKHPSFLISGCVVMVPRDSGLLMSSHFVHRASLISPGLRGEKRGCESPRPPSPETQHNWLSRMRVDKMTTLFLSAHSVITPGGRLVIDDSTLVSVTASTRGGNF